MFRDKEEIFETIAYLCFFVSVICGLLWAFFDIEWAGLVTMLFVLTSPFLVIGAMCIYVAYTVLIGWWLEILWDEIKERREIQKQKTQKYCRIKDSKNKR